MIIKVYLLLLLTITPFFKFIFKLHEMKKKNTMEISLINDLKKCFKRHFFTKKFKVCPNAELFRLWNCYHKFFLL